MLLQALGKHKYVFFRFHFCNEIIFVKFITTVHTLSYSIGKNAFTTCTKTAITVFVVFSISTQRQYQKKRF